MRVRLRGVLASLVVSALLQGCGGGGASGGGSAPAGFANDCGANCAQDVLTAQDVEQVIAQAVTAAQAQGQLATVAVTDRVGNVLGVYAMNGATGTFRIDGGRGVFGGLEQVAVLPSAAAAISKALTGAYLSSAGNAFTSRTASQIVQEHFNPSEANQLAGPLFGVQFSQLSCSDLMRRDDSVAAGNGTLGPKRSPLGLSADPGGLPLYKNGRLVGGIGVMADAVYGLDLDITNIDADVDETLAVAGTLGFEAPVDIRANRITLDGRSARYVDAVQTGVPATSIAGLPGALIPVAGYFPGAIRAGTAYGQSASGVRRDTGVFASLGGYVLVDASDSNLFPVRAATDGGLSAPEAQQILQSALALAARARGQIRRPLGQAAQVTITVVDTNGEVLGLVRAPDAPIFGTDVALQKARSAAFMSNPVAGAELLALPAAVSPLPMATSAMGPYVTALRSFMGNAFTLSNGVALSTKAIGNLSRPFFPDGIIGTSNGPLSKPYAQWSPFSDGMQLDISINAIVKAAFGDLGVGCTGLNRLRNGLQIFSGGMPIYRVVNGTAQLLGGIGVSGDGTDQDDMIAFLGLAQAGAVLGNGIGNAPPALRADAIPLSVGRLRYVQCPVAPFNDSNAQNVCTGL
ncbi:MAG: heme-binding protein [Rhodoferax sp.]|nr:heme-binding protein [Rhodoferax sp.]MBP9930404.1 heme-binding protein [Rhodoferax sp.]